MNIPRSGLILFATLAASPALAHNNVGSGASFLSGFAHPFTGADHLLAMIAVGLWAGLLGRRALVMLPVSFLGAMLGGAIAAMSGLLLLPLVETGIIISIPVLWAVIAFGFTPPAIIGASLCAIFAFVHGFAHGAELIEGSDPTLYSAGFLLATCVLLVLGACIARQALARARTP